MRVDMKEPFQRTNRVREELNTCGTNKEIRLLTSEINDNPRGHDEENKEFDSFHQQIQASPNNIVGGTNKYHLEGDILDFNSNLDVGPFLDWLYEVEKLFEVKNHMLEGMF